jgi:hypothetical protein
MKVDGGSFSREKRYLRARKAAGELSPGVLETRGSEQLLENVVLDIAG